MGQRIRNNFNKRFGGRICVVYAQKLSVEEKKLLNEKLCKAMIEVLSGILGREPTQREILGLDDISQCKLKKTQ